MPRRRTPRRRPATRGPVHTAKWDRCIADVKARGEKVDPYAVCTAALGERGSIRPGHRRQNPRAARGRWIITATRRGRPVLVYQGDRFGWEGERGGREALWKKAVLFPTRGVAAQFARHLKTEHKRQLAGWRLQVNRV